MDDATRAFERLRPRLQGIAYRMLGSAIEAEVVVQDVWQRWQVAAQAELDRAEAWLVATTTRQCLIYLRARNRDGHSIGASRPPNRIDSGFPGTPESMQEWADEISVAFLTLLENLPCETRTAYLLREMFDVPYNDIAGLLHKNETDCRHLVSRAKNFLRSERPRHFRSRDPHFCLLSRFAEAMASADLMTLKSMLAEGAELSGEGANRILCVDQPFRSGRRIAQHLVAASLRLGSALSMELSATNGQWELMFFVDGEADSVLSCKTDENLITHIHVRHRSH